MAPAAAPSASAEGATPLLDTLAATGVDRIGITAVLVGGRWLVEHEWTGQQPGKPQTLATMTSGHGERLGSLEDVVAQIVAQATEDEAAA